MRDDDLDQLTRVPLFAALEEDALRFLAFSAEARILRGGDFLFRAGEPADCGYFITSGQIILDPGEKREMKAVGPGTLIGELALISSTTRPITARAREPTVVLKLGRAQFHRMLQEYPASAARLRATMGARLRTLTASLRAIPGFAEEEATAPEALMDDR